MTMLIICIAAISIIFAQAMTIIEIRSRSRETNNQLRQLDEGMTAFVEFFSLPDKETGLTGFDASLNNLANVTATQQANIIVASMRGTVSGAVRSAEAGFKDLAYEENPLQAAIMDALPKKIARNPVASMGVEAFFSKLLSGAGGAGRGPKPDDGGGNGHNSQPAKFRL